MFKGNNSLSLKRNDSRHKMKQASFALIERTRLIAIVRLDDLSEAGLLTKALLKAGVRVLEFTLSNPHAIACVEKIKKEFPIFSSEAAMLGVGSVTDVNQTKDAIAGGADFIVSPILNTKIIESCRKQGILVLPGTLTPTEIHTAWKAGADLIKVFPAESLGPSYIKAVLAPMPHLPLVPGGIGVDNLKSYLDMGAIADVLFIADRDAKGGLDLADDSEPEEVLDLLEKKFPHALIVMTLGEAGAIARTPDGVYFSQPIFPAKEIGRLGRGDAFSAGFLYTWLSKDSDHDLSKCLEWGAAMAALKSTVPGDIPWVDKEMVDNLLNQKGASSFLQR